MVYNAGSLAAAEARKGQALPHANVLENPYDFTDSLIEQYGTPEMLLKELRSAK